MRNQMKSYSDQVSKPVQEMFDGIKSTNKSLLSKSDDIITDVVDMSYRMLEIQHDVSDISDNIKSNSLYSIAALCVSSLCLIILVAQWFIK